MDCRETQKLLSAFHDGELSAADRARVEEHLRGCPECVALLADLARADHAAGAPDPGPEYWDRFNARVMERVEQEAAGAKVTALRPKHGWMRQQFRYLVPAAAAAVLVAVVVRYGGMHPGAPPPTTPSAAIERAAPEPAGVRGANVEPEPRSMKKTESAAVVRPAPPSVLAKERFSTVTREERDRLAAPSLQAGNVGGSRHRTTAPAAIGVPSPSPLRTIQGAPAGSPPAAADAESASGMRIAKGPPAGSPCELARELAARERFPEAEEAQRACLAGDLDASSREKGLVFLAELLDRQARFSEADAVLAEVEKQYPRSRPLDRYRQRRPMVQKQPKAVPVTR